MGQGKHGQARRCVMRAMHDVDRDLHAQSRSPSHCARRTGQARPPCASGAGRPHAACMDALAEPRYPAVCGVSLGDARRRTRRMPRAAYSAWRAASYGGRTVQARASGAWTTIGTSATVVTPMADACGAVSGGSGLGRRMLLARQRMFRQPIQLPRCSSTIVLKRLRDFCYVCIKGPKAMYATPTE